MTGAIIKALAVGAGAVFVSEFAVGMDFARGKEDIAKYGGAALGAFVAMKLV